MAAAADARPLPGAVEVLAALAERYAVVAVVSGRPVAFLRAHLPGAVELHGLYGLEAVVDGAPVVQAEARGVARRSSTRWPQSAAVDGPPGLDVEHKGLSLTLHYRRQPELADAAVALGDRRPRSDRGSQLRRAKMSVELHPPVAVDKGTVVEARAAGMSTVAYIGDDEGDLPAFAALDRLAGPRGHDR